jgi:hypothetical protein
MLSTVRSWKDRDPSGCIPRRKPDTSLYGWGAHVGKGDLFPKGMWTEEESCLSINMFEIKAVVLGVQTFKSTLLGSVRPSSLTTLLWSRIFVNGERGTHFDTLCRLTWDLFQLCARLDIKLIPRHISGKRKFLADAPSRADHLVQTEWTLHRNVVQTLIGMWDAPMSRYVRHQAEQATPPVLLSPTG